VLQALPASGKQYLQAQTNLGAHLDTAAQ